MTRTWPIILTILLLAIARPAAESLADYPDDAALTHLRTTSARIQTMIRDGIRFSPSFQAIVDRLDASDVVVYIEPEFRPQEGIDGRMTFLSAAGGVRYLLVRVAFLPDAARQIAILGHELRHAVEIADAPGVVDQATMTREYGRIGYRTRCPVPMTHTYDTAAANTAGVRVYKELTTGSGD